jgi:hypothetical protein
MFRNNNLGKPIKIKATKMYIAGTERGKKECEKNAQKIITILEARIPIIIVKIACGGMYLKIARYKPVRIKKMTEAIAVVETVNNSGKPKLTCSVFNRKT